jgi:hypothetical protein
VVAASRTLHALDHSASTETAATTDPGRRAASRRRRGSAFVLLNARTAPKLPARQFYPPESTFHP